MVIVDGINVSHTLASKVTINGFWVSATIDGQPVDIRTPKGDNWLDRDHKRLTEALSELESAIAGLVGERPLQ